MAARVGLTGHLNGRWQLALPFSQCQGLFDVVGLETRRGSPGLLIGALSGNSRVPRRHLDRAEAFQRSTALRPPACDIR